MIHFTPFTIVVEATRTSAPTVEPSSQPIADEIRTDCVRYLHGASYQDDQVINSTNYVSHCRSTADVYSVHINPFVI